MAYLNKEEFAAMCRTTVAVLNTNISRNKIVYDKEDKTIDSEDPLNKAFFKKYKKKAEDEESKTKITDKIEHIYNDVVDKVTAKVTSKVDADKKETKQNKSREKSQSIVDWTERKTIADAQLQEARAEKEQMQLEKLAGKLIPIDLTFRILNIHNNDIFATFHNDVDNLASVFCDILAGGDRKKLAEISGKLSEKLADCVKRAKEVSESSIRNAIDEYQEVRNRGEKK